MADYNELPLYDKQQLNNAKIAWYTRQLSLYELQQLNTAQSNYYNAMASEAWNRAKLIEAQIRLANLQADELEHIAKFSETGE